MTTHRPASLQEQARLGDPTRHRIFRYVADAGRPVGVAELTARFELNHNAIRQHLAKLVDAGLVTEATAAAADTVCALHLGIAEGLAAAGEDIVVDELVANDPRRAHCRLRLHLGPSP